ncbi:MAG: RNA-dependent DNA polymerase [Rheinheimera sp.]|nr:RNA-dependent DNA polymerase [Rheinheimera sp.]MBM35371.1 RNA-dependent DNA polymerase [Rheinheimera sp.]|tara:strand:- start:1651 stop:2601 length:951 start_codon:yes stop_codon:yes gene_type:complete
MVTTSLKNAVLLQDLPVIFELEHLSKIIGVEIRTLQKMIYCSRKFYRSFSIPKRNGSRRQIDAPYPTLLLCQKWIYENILKKTSVHHSAHGFIEKKSIITNALPHKNKKTLLKIDLKDFFPSIPLNWVVNHFLSLGYANNVSFYLASLCSLEGNLCQGAPTSPYLSNILLTGLDNRLTKLAASYCLEYTRYADDMTFSGNYIPHTLIVTIENVISSYGLSVNSEKTRLHLKKGQRIVTGISVSGDSLSVPREYKRALKQEIHFIERYGYISHVSKLKINDPLYLEKLIGKVNFWLQVEPENNFAKHALKLLRAARK